jgi:hypothetical protein
MGRLIDQEGWFYTDHFVTTSSHPLVSLNSTLCVVRHQKPKQLANEIRNVLLVADGSR